MTKTTKRKPTSVDHHLPMVSDHQGIQVVHHDTLQTYFDMKAVEKTYDMSYVGEFCLTLKRKTGDDPVRWANFPALVFWGEEAHPEGSNYMALYRCPIRDAWTVTDGFHAIHDYEGNPIKFPIVLDKQEHKVYGLYSAYRHDYQCSGETMIDGGRDYVKSSGHPLSRFIIKNGKIIIDNTAD